MSSPSPTLTQSTQSQQLIETKIAPNNLTMTNKSPSVKSDMANNSSNENVEVTKVKTGYKLTS
jgi:hypothetical protein